MDNEIKEISHIIAHNIEFYDVGAGDVLSEKDKTAKAIYDAGYRKIVWHKVADGDLPEYGRYVVGIMAESNVPTVCSLKKIGQSKIYVDLWDIQIDDDDYHGLNEIIAWAELPEYKKGIKKNGINHIMLY